MGRQASITGPDIGQIMNGLGSSIRAGSQATLVEAVTVAKRMQIVEMQRAIGTDMRMSGVGHRRGRRGNAKIGIRYDFMKKGEIPEAKVKATGPAHLIERDTGGRVIRSSWARGRGFRASGDLGQMLGPGIKVRGDRRAAINIPGVGFRRSARHPGTKGKHPFRNGQKKAAPRINRIMRKRTFNIIKKAAKP